MHAGAVVLALTLLAAGDDVGPVSTPANGGGRAAAPPLDVAPVVDAVFARGFAFCHDPRFPLTAEDLRWCTLMPRARTDPRCPDLLQACARGAVAGVRAGGETRQGDGDAQLSLPAFGTLARSLLWVLLGLGVAWVISRVVEQALAHSRVDPVRASRPAPVVEPSRARDVAPVETGVERLLDRARAAAVAGNFAQAVDHAYAALLRRWEAAGVVRVEPHRTNGDHVRDVARKLPALRPGLESVVTTVERAQFGGDPPDAASYSALHDRVVALMGERVGQFFPAAVGLALAATLAGCAANPRRPGQQEAPSGRAAVLAFLQQSGLQARERLVPLARIEDATQQLLLFPGASVDSEDWDALAAWVARGGTLLVAGGGRALPDWMGATIGASPTAASAEVAPASDQVGRFARFGRYGPPRPTAILPPGRELLLDDGEPADAEVADIAMRPLLLRGRALYAVEGDYQKGRVVLLADDRLFTNASLLVADNAALLIDLVHQGGDSVELAGELTGLVSANPFTAVSRGRLAPALGQLALLALLFFGWKGAQFGRPIDPVVTRRRAFSEHVRALGLKYARGGATRHALESYGAYALERMRERLHLAGGKGLHVVAEAVAARSGRPPGDVMRVLAEAHGPASSAPPAGTPADDLTTLREIVTLLSEMGGAGERSRARGQG